MVISISHLKYLIRPEKQREIDDLVRRGDYLALRDFAAEYDTRNLAVAAEARRCANELYEKQNPITYVCPGCEFTSREQQRFIAHLESKHEFQDDKARFEADRQMQQTGATVSQTPP